VRQDEFTFTGVPGETFAQIDRALDERTIGHNPERLNLMKVPGCSDAVCRFGGRLGVRGWGWVRAGGLGFRVCFASVLLIEPLVVRFLLLASFIDESVSKYCKFGNTHYSSNQTQSNPT